MKRALLWLSPALAILVLAEVLHRALFAMGIVHTLLGSTRPSLGALVMLLLFYSVRLTAFFVVPGWIAFVLVLQGRRMRRMRPASDSAQ